MNWNMAVGLSCGGLMLAVVAGMSALIAWVIRGGNVYTIRPRFGSMSLWWCDDCKIAYAPGPSCPRCGKGGIRQEEALKIDADLH
jgi:hypothetical protein